MRQQPLNHPRRVALGIAATVVVVDQLTKWWALEALRDAPIQVIGEFFELSLTRNSGAAFNLLQGAGSILALLAVIVVVVIVFAVGSARDRLSTFALGLVLGGAVGNLLDRLFRGEGLADGEVVDFLDFSFWPTFNIADAAITVGALLALLEAVRSPSKSSSPIT